jgi:hypothetical protein
MASSPSPPKKTIAGGSSDPVSKRKIFKSVSSGFGHGSLKETHIDMTDVHELFFEYVMVFKLEQEEEGGAYKQDHYCKHVCAVMKEAGLILFPYLSVQQDELIVLIRAPVSSLICRTMYRLTV